MAINRAVAVGFAEGPEAGLAILDGLDADPRLDRYQPLHAARAELLRQAGHLVAADAAYAQAIDLSGNRAEHAALEDRRRETAGRQSLAMERAKAIPPDYDQNPERFHLARSILREHGLERDVHPHVARRLLDERLTPVLDVGCGDGELARHLPGGAWVGLDSSCEMLAKAPAPTVQADATALPFPDESFGSVALLYILELPSRSAVCDYLVGKRVDLQRARAAAELTDTPLTVTKRGALAFARRA